MALFTITKMWKQPICPSTGEWIKKITNVFYKVYTMILGFPSSTVAKYLLANVEDRKRWGFNP